MKSNLLMKSFSNKIKFVYTLNKYILIYIYKLKIIQTKKWQNILRFTINTKK